MTPEPTLYLHVGLPKTASTHLQRAVFPRLDHVDVRSMPVTSLFDTPADRARDSRLMAACFHRSVEVWARRGDEVFAELLGEPAPPTAPRHRGLLVSEEGIGRAASRPHLLRQHLEAMAERAAVWGFRRVRVLCVFRRQDRWLGSHYAQGADRRPAPGQADFDAMVAETIDPAGERCGFGMLLDYEVLRRELAAAVGPEAVTMLPFEWLERSPDSFLDAVLETLDTPPAERERLRVEAIPDGRTNAKASGDRTWALSRPPVLPKAVSRLLPRAVHRRLEWRLQRRLRRSVTLTPEASARILAAYGECNLALGEALGIDLNALGYGVAG